MTIAIIIIFIAGYIAIATEHVIKIDKAASALISGVLCWTIYILSSGNKELINEQLLHHLGDIASILFFLMGAMMIVELVDRHDGFSIITNRIKTTNTGRLLLVVCLLTFFLSALLDNLTTTIVMLSLTGKLLSDKKDRWYFAGMVIIAANAGGAWSPLGDVTTTMLWIGGQVSGFNIMAKLFLPSLICAAIPLLILWFRFRKKTFKSDITEETNPVPQRHKHIMLYSGIGCLLFVPAFKTYTHLPPFMGMMLGVGFLWTVVSFLHRSKDHTYQRQFSASTAIQRIDGASILFFLGILLSVSALEAYGILGHVATFLSDQLHKESYIGISLGLLSSIIDNVPLVAATQGMYSLYIYPTDHFFWELLAYATGTGGSAIIIGSAAGVAAMGIEKVEFGWYLKHISWLALIGFFAGAITYISFN
jgi:Na+/H+ antiporter NhaD/arsenite permease-like protein